MRPLLLLVIILAGCSAPETGPGVTSSTPHAATSPQTPEFYESGWVGADLVWVSDPRSPDGRGISAGTMLAYVPKEAEPDRVLLFNVTVNAGAGLSFRVREDGLEVASMPLALGENRLEVPAPLRARYEYDFPASAAGGASVHVGIATRGTVPPDSTDARAWQLIA